MSNKILCILLLLIFLFLFYFLYQKMTIYKNQNSSPLFPNNQLFEQNFEHFESNAWTTDKDKLKAEKEPLNDIQKTEVKNMIEQLGKEQLKTLISQQSPLLTGPSGPVGPQGPAGTKLVASGRLVNKVGSFSKKEKQNDSENKISKFNPDYVVSRTEGTNAASSLSYMDNISPFTSYQNWELDINNNIKSRYDNNCLTMDDKNNKLHMSQCSDNPNQKWTWDNSNRIISTTNSTPSKLKCIGLTKPEINTTASNVPGCKSGTCANTVAREYLVVKDCDVNNIYNDEVWSFV